MAMSKSKTTIIALNLLKSSRTLSHMTSDSYTCLCCVFQDWDCVSHNKLPKVCTCVCVHMHSHACAYCAFAFFLHYVITMVSLNWNMGIVQWYEFSYVDFKIKLKSLLGSLKMIFFILTLCFWPFCS